MRPFLAPLDDDMRGGFTADYTARIVKAYPARFDGKVLLPFPPSCSIVAMANSVRSTCYSALTLFTFTRTLVAIGPVSPTSSL